MPHAIKRTSDSKADKNPRKTVKDPFAVGDIEKKQSSLLELLMADFKDLSNRGDVFNHVVKNDRIKDLTFLKGLGEVPHALRETVGLTFFVNATIRFDPKNLEVGSGLF